MTDRPTDLSSLPSTRLPRRGLFSARKFALMASVVAGLGVAAYGLSPQGAPLDLFTTSAHAQVANEVSKVARPVGFADIVERVKPSVISVKVNIAEKVAKNDSDEDTPFQPGSPMERFFRRFGGENGIPGMPFSPPKRRKKRSIGEPGWNGVSSSELSSLATFSLMLTLTEMTDGFTRSTMSAKPIGRATLLTSLATCACAGLVNRSAGVPVGLRP